MLDLVTATTDYYRFATANTEVASFIAQKPEPRWVKNRVETDPHTP